MCGLLGLESDWEGDVRNRFFNLHVSLTKLAIVQLVSINTREKAETHMVPCGHHVVRG